MNILTVLRASLNSQGAFHPEPRVHKHLLETLKAQDGDVLRIGVIRGQRGVAQVRVVPTPDDSTPASQPKYEIQLLPLCFSSVEQAIAVSEALQPPAAAVETPRSGSAVYNWKSSLARIRADRYKFPPLSESELEQWFEHPYALGPSLRPTPTNVCALSELVPSETKIQRQTQPRIDLFMALPRPKLLEKVLQYAGSMSIGRIHFFASSRSDMAYFSSPRLREASMNEHLRIGLEQGMRTTPSPVVVSASLQSAVELAKQFYATSEDQFRTLIAHPYQVGCPVEGRLSDKASGADGGEILTPAHMLTTDLVNYTGCVILTLGPEGGFTDAEIRTIVLSLPSPQLVSLGTDILRCEVALLSLIGQTQMLITANNNASSRKPHPALTEAAIWISPPGRKKPRLADDQSASPNAAES